MCNLGYKQVIWDWNGTLLNDAELCVRLVNEVVFAHIGATVSLEAFRQAYQHPIKNMYAELGVVLSDQEFQVMTQDWLNKYEEHRVNCALHKGADQILNQMRAVGIRQFILSAHKHDLVLAAVRHHQIEEYFEEILGLELGGGHSKVENAKDLFKRMNANLEEVLLIGDSCHDHEVAEALNIDCHLIASGADSSDKLKKTHRAVFCDLSHWRACFGI